MRDKKKKKKMFRNSEVLREAFRTPFITKWLFDIEIFARVLRVRGTKGMDHLVEGRPIPHWKDVGDSKFRRMDYFLAVWQFVQLKRAYPELKR